MIKPVLRRPEPSDQELMRVTAGLGGHARLTI